MIVIVAQFYIMRVNGSSFGIAVHELFFHNYFLTVTFNGIHLCYLDPIACGYDGYTVALPAELHYPAGRKLLEKGLNVMLEKPMTLTAAQSAELVELAQRTGARLMIAPSRQTAA